MVGGREPQADTEMRELRFGGLDLRAFLIDDMAAEIGEFDVKKGKSGKGVTLLSGKSFLPHCKLTLGSGAAMSVFPRILPKGYQYKINSNQYVGHQVHSGERQLDVG